MKKLLMLIILPVFLVSCNENTSPDFRENDEVIFTKKCAGRFGRIEKGTKAIVRTNSVSDHVYIFTDKVKEVVRKDCLELAEKHQDELDIERYKKQKKDFAENIDTWKENFDKKPASKFEVVQEYLEFDRLCKEYGKLFKSEFVTEITEKDELNCDGKNQKQIEYDIELINRFRRK